MPFILNNTTILIKQCRHSPQTQPPMGHRRPPAGSMPRPPLPAPSSSNYPSSMPQRRPQLVRRVNTSQGRIHSGRDLSNASDGSARDRCNSDGKQGDMRYERIQSVGTHPSVATDTRLLLASLDKQAVEDEAEAVRIFSRTFAHTVSLQESSA